MSPGFIVPNDLVGWWCPSLDATGAILLDRSGRNNHGTLTNMDPPTDWVISGGKGALDFDAVDDRVVVRSLSLAGVFSVSMWCNRRSQGVFAERIVFGNSASANTYVADITNTTVITSSDAPGTARTFSGFSFSNNVWFHLLVARSANNGVRVYVDGRESTSGEQSVAGTYTLNQIGAYSTDARFYWDGRLDDIRIYNRALTATEVRQLYQIGRGNMPLRRRRRYTEQAAGGNRRRRVLLGAEC
jgi:hypothetical protein